MFLTFQIHLNSIDGHLLTVSAFYIPLFCLNKNFQRKIVNIFLPIVFSICFGCSKEQSHRDSSFEYPQHMFRLRNKKIILLLHSFVCLFDLIL